MDIKISLLGGFIYTAMALYVLAFCLLLSNSNKAYRAVFLLGFAVITGGWIYRWIHVQHVPMQNMFEVFLTLGMLIYPISLFSEKFLKIQETSALASDLILGIIILFPAGFVFSEDPQMLPPALQSWMFGPHVAVYMLSYIILAKAAVYAAESILGGKTVQNDQGVYYLICFGYPLLTMGLLLGSVWGKWAWGRWWGWDPKEMWSLVCWLVYALYFHWRWYHRKKHLMITHGLAIAGFACILITLLWVNLSNIFKGLHNYAS